MARTPCPLRPSMPKAAVAGMRLDEPVLPSVQKPLLPDRPDKPIARWRERPDRAVPSACPVRLQRRQVRPSAGLLRYRPGQRIRRRSSRCPRDRRPRRCDLWQARSTVWKPRFLLGIVSMTPAVGSLRSRASADHCVGNRCGGARRVAVPVRAPVAAWLGLTPRPHSSGGKERLSGISKQGDGYLRKLLVVGATAVMRMARKYASRHPWLAHLLERKPAKIATVGLANKTARIAWAVMARNEVYAAAPA